MPHSTRQKYGYLVVSDLLTGLTLGMSMTLACEQIKPEGSVLLQRLWPVHKHVNDAYIPTLSAMKGLDDCA